jgi:hypothetical protein
MLDWALAMDPGKRYPTAQEFAIDLSMLIAAEPMDAVEPTPMNRAPSAEFVSPSAPTVADARQSSEPKGGASR